jgi:hypothetical protein
MQVGESASPRRDVGKMIDGRKFTSQAAYLVGTPRFCLASTTLAESVCANVFQGFAFGSMDTVETAVEG